MISCAATSLAAFLCPQTSAKCQLFEVPYNLIKQMRMRRGTERLLGRTAKSRKAKGEKARTQAAV
jgi:hypothetical protein